MAGAFQTNAFQDTPAFQTGNVVPFVGKSLWQFHRDQRDARARLEAETAQQAANEPELEPAAELPDLRHETAHIAEHLVGFAYLLEREQFIAQQLALEAHLQALALAELQRQAIAAAEAQRALEALQAADDAAALALLCWLMLED